MKIFTPPSSDRCYDMMSRAVILLCMMLCFAKSSIAQSEKNIYDAKTLLFTLTEQAFLQEKPMLTIRDDIFRETDIPIADISQPFADWGATPYWQNFYAITLKEQEDMDMSLGKIAGMESVSEVFRVPMVSTFQLPPNDPQTASQWHLNTVQAASGWNSFTPSSLLPPVDPVVIAVVDDAVDIAHPDLASNLWTNPATGDHGFDFADMDGDPSPPASASSTFFNHGTHVAGISNAATNNAQGIASLAYNVELMALKCAANSSANPRQFGILAVVNGINYAVANGADIINLSLGTTVNFPPMEQAILNARVNDVMVVAAAGNDNTNVAPFPGGYADVITVASTDGADQRSSFSNYGPWVDISAPGSNILSTLPGNNYGTLSGTSMATPLVASALALMKSYRPSVPNDFLIDCLLNNTTDISALNPSYIGDLGSGRLNIDLAIQCTDGLIANLTADATSACVGQMVTFTATANAGATYSWDFGDGTPATVPSTANTVSHTYNGSLVGVVTLTVDNGTNSATDQLSMVVSPCDVTDPTQAHWYFGNQLAVDFTSGIPQADQSACINGTIAGTIEVAAVMSDANGNLLFYTDGERVWNSSHTQINTTLLISNYSMSNGVIIAPVPGATDDYYIFHSDAPLGGGSNRGLHFSLVNTTGGIATMTSINNPITPPAGYTAAVTGALQTGEQITIVPNCDGYWMITTAHTGTDMDIVLFSVDASGISFSHAFSYGTGTLFNFNWGYLKASPDGKMLAYADNHMVNSGIHLMDFDPETGTISNLRQIETTARWGLAFSPDSKVLYATTNWWDNSNPGVWQYDLSQSNPSGVDIINGIIVPQSFGGIQLGPDGKMYLKQYKFGHPFLSTIHFPNQLNQPGFVYNDVDLNPGNQTCMVTFPSQNMSFGLPNLIDAKPVIFEEDQFTYTVSNCNTYSFTGPACSSSYFWNFNDGKYPTSTDQNPTHVFSEPGTYDVTLTTDNFSMIQTIVINDIEAEVIGTEEICEEDLGGTYSYFAQTNAGNYSYQWTATGGNIVSIPTASLVDVTWTSLPAQLTLVVTDLYTDCQKQVIFEINACPVPIDGCTNCTEVVEEVNNGDFELGAMGAGTFNTQLANAQGCNIPGSFFIGATAQSKCSTNSPNLYDHTIGTRDGNYMIVDEYLSQLNYLVWMQQGVPVVKGEKYIFSFWHLRNLSTARPTQYQEYVLWVDGHIVDTISTQGAVDKVWTRYCAEWESDRTGNVPIAIYRVNNTDPTLPYGIDDISFGACVDCEVTADFSQLGLYGSPWRNFYDRSTSSGTITSYSWDFGDPASGSNNTSTIEDPVHRFTAVGLYDVCLTVRATQGGEECESTICRSIKITKQRYVFISPNPIKGKILNFEVEEYGEPFYDIAEVAVLNASTGKPLISVDWNEAMENKVDVSSLAEGVYLFEVLTKDGERLRERFIME